MLEKISSWFRKSEKNIFNEQYVKEAIELVDLVSNEIKTEHFAKNYLRQATQCKSALIENVKDDTLSIFLLGEQIIHKQKKVAQKDKLNYRKKLLTRFEYLRDHDIFKITLLETDKQERELALLFLNGIFDNYRLVNGIDKNLIDSHKSKLDHIIQDQGDKNELITIAKDLFSTLETNLGNEAALIIYQDIYYAISEKYRLLEGFPFLIKLVPEDQLNIDQLETLNKFQTQSLLMEKIDVLEFTNEKLSHEIKEKEKVESELKESENLLNKIIESAMDAMVLLDENGHINYWSVQSEYLLGWNSNEIIGEKFVDKLLSPNQSNDFIENLEALNLHSNHTLAKKIFESQLLNKNADVIDVEISVASVKLSKKWIICAFIRDISQRKRYENEIIQARDKAEEASAAKLKFLSMMSHEIRTPLNAVIGTSQLLLEENPRKDQLENLNILKFSAENLLGIINDILDFNKVEEGKLILDDQTFNLDLLCQNVVNSFIPQSKEKGIEIKYANKLKRINLVSGDETRLSQVLINLFGNAVKFTADGSVTLSVELINLNNREGEVKFEVIDTGIGISSEKISTVFDRFIQVHQFDAKKKYGGTGLGLSISKSIVNLMGGELSVSSKLNEGSNFYFSIKLPIPFKEDPTKEIEEQDEFNIIFNKKILIVEDHKINQIVASKFLKKYKCLVEIAENGEIAVNKVKENSYDLILMDLEMPILNGYEAAIAIRNLEKDSEVYTPIVALSANALTDVSKKVQDAGMNGYISKPFESQHFYAQIADNIKR